MLTKSKSLSLAHNDERVLFVLNDFFAGQSVRNYINHFRQAKEAYLLYAVDYGTEQREKVSCSFERLEYFIKEMERISKKEGGNDARNN